MKNILVVFLLITCCSSSSGFGDGEDAKYIFFLHNRFPEEYDLRESHPEYGRTEYHAIPNVFKSHGFNVISEIRQGNINARQYAQNVCRQVDSLLDMQVKPSDITVIGTSKGGYIAQYVSTFMQKPDLNFVFVACFTENDLQNIPEINFCGNILTIYEKTDPFGVSAIKRKETSTCNIKHFKEIELNTGLRHGFLFKPLKEWTDPAVQWAKGNYTPD